jgi:Type II secretory pathway, component PulF
MKHYWYKAKDLKGNLITGEVEAPTPEAAAKLVRGKRLIVIDITQTGTLSLNLLNTWKDRVTSSSVMNFTRQFATMINAGLPITEALLILRTQDSGAMEKIVSQLLADVEEGESLSSSMAKHTSVFSKTYVALIKSGEIGGVLDDVLIKLSDDLEKREEFKGKIKGAMIYPVIVVFGMIAVAFIMLVFVIPRLSTLYDQFGTKLPISTRIVVGASNIASKYWPLILGAVGLGGFLLKNWVNTKEGKRKYEEIIFALPIVGDLQKQIILTNLTRTLSLMVGSGVAIIEALTISSQVVTNSIIAAALQDTTKLVEKGFPLAFAFSKHPEAFPFILSQMVAVGEETGRMDEVLAKVSHVFEVESDQKVKSLTAAIEPIILIVLGIGVAFLVISIILPIYNLTTQF